MNTFDAATLAQWRKWLVEHHDLESEVWLIFHKRHTGRASVAYQDALDEALCFDWIDSLVKRLDDARYARKFTPRKPNSKWSAINRKHYARLKASGRLMPAGLARPPTARTYAPRRTFSSKVPRYIQEALGKHPRALKHFEGLAPSLRRRYVGWIDLAKREETKIRRLKKVLRVLAVGKLLGLK